jgi:hypothetical protein
VAVRHQLEGEPFRVRLPVRVPRPVELALFGTALSGPLAVDGLLVALGERPGVVRGLGWLRVVGVLSEPATWGRRRPRWTVVISAAQAAAGVALSRA